jgi:isopentenyl-diphosphate delta-isomerase
MDKSDELLDLVSEKDEVIGTIRKSEAHKDSTKIHREVAIAIFNQNGEVLIQRRSLNKANDPGLWKITAAGHVGAGENSKVAAEREIFEELGLAVDAEFLRKGFEKRVGKRGSTEARFFYIYYATVKGSPPVLKLDKTEVMDIKWIRPDKLEAFSKGNDWDVKGLSHKIIMEIYSKLFNGKVLYRKNRAGKRRKRDYKQR